MEDLTLHDDFFEPPPAPSVGSGSSVPAAYASGTETRFLVVEPRTVTYTKEGKVRKPRNDSIARVHNTIVRAKGDAARQWNRQIITTEEAKHNPRALLFIAANTLDPMDGNRDDQIHVWAEEYYKHQSQTKWVRNGDSQPRG